MNDFKWSKTEKGIAQRAYRKAYENEYREILNKAREMANAATEPGDLWRLHDFLTDKRNETDEKYDYRYSVLVILFTRLVREGWITLEDLDGLKEDKLSKIRLMVEW